MAYFIALNYSVQPPNQQGRRPTQQESTKFSPPFKNTSVSAQDCKHGTIHNMNVSGSHTRGGFYHSVRVSTSLQSAGQDSAPHLVMSPQCPDYGKTYIYMQWYVNQRQHITWVTHIKPHGHIEKVISGIWKFGFLFKILQATSVAQHIFLSPPSKKSSCVDFLQVFEFPPPSKAYKGWWETKLSLGVRVSAVCVLGLLYLGCIPCLHYSLFSIYVWILCHLH